MPTWMYLVILALIGLALFVATVREWRRYPRTACPRCKGSGKAYQPGKGRRFHGDCRRCGGSGTRNRDGVKFLDKWNGGDR
jgi:hypothetical protein